MGSALFAATGATRKTNPGPLKSRAETSARETGQLAPLFEQYTHCGLYQ